MKKTLIFHILTLLILQYGYSQVETCGDIPCLAHVETNDGCTGSIGSETVKLYFHVYRDNDGNGGQSPGRIQQCVDNLNDAFSSSGISFFYNQCEIRWVNDSDLWCCPSQYCDIFHQSTAHDDGIDVHLFGDDTYTARACSIPGGELMLGGMKGGVTPTSLASTAPHEMGHCLGLFHTHHNEFPDNFKTCPNYTPTTPAFDYLEGDYVNDTNPDPLGQGLPSACNYVHTNFSEISNFCDGNNDADGNEWIINGVTYWRPCFDISLPPPTTNIMSYYHDGCRTEFTHCQSVRMHEFMLEDIKGGSPNNATCCGEYTLMDGSNVDDLVALLPMANSVSDLSNISAEVLIAGTFVVDKYVRLGESLNLYMSEGSIIDVKPGADFQKVGGFIAACSGMWENIYAQSANVYLYDVNVSGANYAVRLNRATASVDYCQIFNCTFGIHMTASDNVSIRENGIDCSFYAVGAYAGSTYTAFKNIIGSFTKGLYTIYEDQSSSEIIENTIYTDYTGIYSIYNNSHIYHNDIYTENNDRGISFFLSEGDVTDNSIYTSDSYAGIYLNGNTAKNSINNNLIDGDCYSSVLLQGSNNQEIDQNKVTGSSDYGIRAFNSGDNQYVCNEISAGDYGLAITSGSDGLDNKIETNAFLSADLDFYNEAFLGVQWYEADEEGYGNTDWATAESTVTPQQAKFEVSSPAWMPSVTGNSGGLFGDDLATTDASCAFVPGPRPFDPNWICLYISYLEGKKSTNPRAYWYGTYTFLRRYLQRLPKEQWPECLLLFYNSVEECGLISLVEADVAYRVMLSERTKAVKQVTQDINVYVAPTEQERIATAHELKSIRLQSTSELEQLRAEQVYTLSEVDCIEEMFVLWKQVYLLLLKHQDEGLGEDDIATLSDVASLCPNNYGDAVHWAEGLVAAYVPHYVPEYNCEEEIEPRSRSNKTTLQFSVYPNPVSDLLTINVTDYKDANIILSNISGQELYQSQLTDIEMTINTENYESGIYFIELEKDNEIPRVKKIIIQH